MKNFKKILVLALAVIMCLTALSVTAFADTFKPTARISTRFSNNGDRIIAAVVTDQLCGAIEGTLTFTNTEFAGKASYIESTTDSAEWYKVTDNTIKFVIVAKDIEKGNDYWADFYFTVPAGGRDVKFELTGVNACDVNETLVNGIAVKNSEVTISGEALQALGAQYRETNPALRFGSKITRNAEDGNSIQLAEGATAVRCGYLWSKDATITESDTAELKATVDTITGQITEYTSGARNVVAQKCLVYNKDYLIYTVAITGIPSEHEDTKISAVPYLVYKYSNGNYNIVHGEKITKTYAEVQAESKLLDDSEIYGQ